MADGDRERATRPEISKRRRGETSAGDDPGELRGDPERSGSTTGDEMKPVRILMAAALFAIVGAVVAMPAQGGAEEIRKQYVCPACGQACDEKLFDEPGACPACGMRLVEKVDVKDELVPGRAAPDFAAIDQNGKALKLSDYRGKVVVLDFWEHW